MPMAIDTPYLDYRVAFDADRRVLPEDWRLDNYRSRDRLKDGPSYVVHRWMDLTGDGRADDLGVQPAYDLRFVSATHGGVMWTRVIPLPPALRARELRATMSDLIERMSGTGLASVDLGDVTVGEAQTFATREVASQPRIVDGREAWEATIEIASVAQLQLSPDARWERARILLVRVDFLTPARGGRADIHRTLLPALLMVGYANRPEDFERAVPQYESLVSRVRLDTPEGSVAAARAAICAPNVAVVQFVWHAAGGRHRAIGPITPEVQQCLARELAGSNLPAERSYGLRHPALRLRVVQPTSVPLPVTSGGAPTATTEVPAVDSAHPSPSTEVPPPP